MKNIVYYFTDMENMEIKPAEVITAVCLNVAVIICFYVLRSIALYTLAKKQDVKNRWLCFVPFLWLYVASKLMGTIIIGGKTYKHFTLVATIVFALSEIISLVVIFFEYFPLVGYYLSGGEVNVANMTVYKNSLKIQGYEPYYFAADSIFVKGYMHYPYDHITTGKVLTILNLFGGVLSLASLVLAILIYTGFFRKFWPERYVLATVLSVMGLFPIMAFVVRKKKPIDFNEYMRSRYYGHGYNPYGGATYHGQGNHYGQTPPNGRGEYSRPEPESPFGEFEDNKKDEDDPFGFDNRGK